MGESLGDPLRRWAHTRPVQQDPRALVQRRRQLVNYRDDERPLVAASIERIKADIKVVEACIVELVAQDPSTSQDVAVLESTVGVGWVTAVTLLALLPELGRLSRTQVAALVGIAPMNRDSGETTGRRHTTGGRRHVRSALYMATRVGVRHNDVLKARYAHLCSRGKKPKVACMRKLLIHLNEKWHDRRRRSFNKPEKDGC